MENEIWKDIQGYEGIYQVSNLGRVKSLEREIVRSNGRITYQKECILKQKIDKGYYRLGLRKKGIRNFYRVHRLVAIAFIPNPKNKKTVDHINENKLDNRLSNLRWATQEEQIGYAMETGTFEIRKGEQVGGSKLKEKDVLEIREKYVPRKYSQYKLAKEYGVNVMTISDIILRKTWLHI